MLNICCDDHLLPPGAAEVPARLPQVSAGGGAPVGSADLQGEVRGGQVPLPQHVQDPEGARPSGPRPNSVPRGLEAGEPTRPAKSQTPGMNLLVCPEMNR